MKLEIKGDRVLVKTHVEKKSDQPTNTFFVPKSTAADTAILCDVVQVDFQNDLQAGDKIFVENLQTLPSVTIENTTHYFCTPQNILAKVN